MSFIPKIILGRLGSSNWQGKSLSSERACWLERPFYLDEIKEAGFSLPADKAPGLDGFPKAFLQECWQMIKQALTTVFRDFHSNGNITTGTTPPSFF